MLTPRRFTPRDIFKLHQYRRRGVFLDSIPTLTWSDSLVPVGAAFAPISAATGVFTSVLEFEDQPMIIGQVGHTLGSPFAHLTFLAPDDAIESPDLPILLEHLIKQVGVRGAQSLVAEVDEESHSFEALRQANFSIYSRQRIWRLVRSMGQGRDRNWRSMKDLDVINIRKLYNQLVPAMVQQVEPALWGKSSGWVYYQDDELMAFVDIKQGPVGIWAQPFLHPELQNVDALLGALLVNLRPSQNRPAYFCLRSYAAWLSAPMQALGGEEGPPQAVMVRRLTAGLRQVVTGGLPELNGGTSTVRSGNFVVIED